LSAQGSLDLVQKENFSLGKIERQIGFETENELSYLLQATSVWDLMMKRFEKNTTALYNVHQTYVTTASPGGSNGRVDISLLVDVPVNQQIRYSPSFLEKMIELWIQYLALLIPSYLIIYVSILGFGFRSKILDSKTWSEVRELKGRGGCSL